MREALNIEMMLDLNQDINTTQAHNTQLLFTRGR